METSLLNTDPSILDTDSPLVDTDSSLLDTDPSLLDRALEVGGWGRQAVILLAVGLALWQIGIFITGAIFRGRSSLLWNYRHRLLWQITAQHTFGGLCSLGGW